MKPTNSPLLDNVTVGFSTSLNKKLCLLIRKKTKLKLDVNSISGARFGSDQKAVSIFLFLFFTGGFGGDRNREGDSRSNR